MSLDLYRLAAECERADAALTRAHAAVHDAINARDTARERMARVLRGTGPVVIHDGLWEANGDVVTCRPVTHASEIKLAADDAPCVPLPTPRPALAAEAVAGCPCGDML